MEKKYNPKNSCEKIILYCDRSQYGEVGSWQRARMMWHFFFCLTCKSYSKKNSKLSESIKKSKLSSLKPNEMVEIKRKLGEKSDK